MKIDVYFDSGLVDESTLKGQWVCVIDVLRASSTICTALVNGAREIIPVASVDYGMKIASNLFDGQFLLGGERGGKRIQGFDLGNSPREYTAEKVSGKSIVFATTNGTGAIVKARHAEKVLITGFLNLGAITSVLQSVSPSQLYIICGGREHHFSLEDSLCAGALIDRLTEGEGTPTPQLNDAAKVSLFTWQREKDQLRRAVRDSDHGNTLRILGFESDIDLCTDIDKYDVVPVLAESSKIKRMQTETTGRTQV
ncbi:MAG: 2-phosphosulfolactate phosphatase [Bacteroidetes bacterium]|nr:2-phosphosulfolactate phosphatase [Bacteroidota bacterium]